MNNVLVCVDPTNVEGLVFGNIYVDYEQYIEGDSLWVVKNIIHENMKNHQGIYYKFRFKEVPSTKLIRLLFE